MKHQPINWDEHPEAVKKLVQLRNEDKSYLKIAEQLNELFGFNVNEHMTKRAYNKHLLQQVLTSQDDVAEEENEDLTSLPDYKEEHEILKDGSHKSDKLLRMSEEQKKDKNYLLEQHGFDPDEWELLTAKNNIWNVYSKQDGVSTLYSSKITAKPKVNGFEWERLLEEIRKTPPVYLKGEYQELLRKRMLEIPFFDSHFGISSFDYYKPTQDETMERIESRHWEEILFVIGQDMLHNDNFRGQTANGTPIENVDTPNAWRDAKRFYYPLIDKALFKSNKVKIIYSKGNHDESMSWSFVQMLMERYPEAEFDDSFVERKVHIFGKNFIGITHGDKARKNLDKIFPKEFPMEWALATTHEIHTGHFHVEDAKDIFGMMIRTLATRNKTDQWHKDNGFVGAHKRFMLFEYNEQELKSIHYV